MGNAALPPESQDTRQARINSDIIKACSINPIYIKPTARGIGLYTHVAGPKTASQNPHYAYTDNFDGEVALLPLGGPKSAGRDCHTNREAPHKDVAAVYRELQDNVAAEEKIWADMRAAAEARGGKVEDAYVMSLATLRGKYCRVGTQTQTQATAPESVAPKDAQTEKRRHSAISSVDDDEASKRRRVSLVSQDELRRQSLGSNMGAWQTDSQRRGSAGKTGNTYEAGRDPRRQGR